MTAKIKRASELNEIERAVLNHMWKDIKDTKDDGQWRRYEKKVVYMGQPYKVTCLFKLSNQFFTYKNLLITYETQVIEIPQGMGLH